MSNIIETLANGKQAQRVISYLADGTVNDPEDGGAETVSVQVFKGAASYANGQVTASGSAATLLAARATRRSVIFRNTDGSLSVYIGAATVSAANGFLLKAGESIQFDAVGLVQVIAPSGAPVICYIEAYD